jgi:peptidyl-tRNA hydrolase
MASDPNEPVMYLVFRADLKMPVGKVAAQAGHAVQGIITRVASAIQVAKWDGVPGWMERETKMFSWYKSSTKIALQVGDVEAFNRLIGQLIDGGVCHYVVVDEGRTCVEPGSETCLAIEPMARKDAVGFVGKLRLL